MSDTTPPPAAPDSPVAQPPQPQGAARFAARVRAARTEVVAHLVAAFVIGSVAPFLVLWTSPAYQFGVPPGGFELVDIAPELVAVGTLGLALLAGQGRFAWLARSGWLLAAAGLLGFAGLYLQGNTLDGQTLTILLIVVISLQLGGVALAFPQAKGPARWAVAVGLGAGIAGGRDAVALLVREVRRRLFEDGLHGDDVVFAGLGVVVALAGVVLLVSGGDQSAEAAAPRSAVRWPLLGVLVSSVAAVLLTRVWDARLDAIGRSYIGGISEADALKVQYWDQLARVGIAVLVTVVLVVAGSLWGGTSVARWVTVAFATGLLIAGVQLFVNYGAGWLTVVLAVVGAAVGAALVWRLGRDLPWEALALVVATGMLFFDVPSPWVAVGAFGFGFSVAAGALRVVVHSSATGGGGLAVAAALGLASWVLCHQAVVPAAVYLRPDLGGVPILPLGVLLAAAATVVIYLVGRRRPITLAA